MHTRVAFALGAGWALDAFEVQIIGSVIPSVAQEFGLSKAEQIFVFISWYAGIGLGALLFGYLADRLGRRRLFTGTLFLYSFAAVLTAGSPSYGFFVAFRFITALGVGGEYSAVTSAISEFIPARHRGRVTGAVMNFWSLGSIVAGLVGIFFVSALLGERGWRYALLFGGISALYAIYARRLIPESPRWLASRGHVHEANAAIDQITGAPLIASPYLAPDCRSTGLRRQVGELWRHHRARLLFGMTLDFSEASAYYGLFTFMSVFVFTNSKVDVSAASVPYFYLVANVGALVGGLVVSWALERYGRKPTLVLSYGSAAASVILVAGAADTGSAKLTMAAFTTAVFFATCAWVSAYPTFTELFPTHLRGTAVGATVAVGRIGAIAGAVVLAESASAFGLWTAFAALALLWSIGLVAAVWWWLNGIEAHGCSLEALSEG